ncbi:MAG: universal stress protein [Deltaproteobacteria bacterium]|nr:universal stress protein [Deltaproteobacteria bacterium]
MFAPKRILVPTDFSSYSDNALRHAIDMARQYRATVYLLHVIDEHIQQCAADYCLSDTVMTEIEHESMVTSNDKLHQQVTRVSGNSQDVEIIPYLKRGIPFDEILKEQEEKTIDLIVIASHGRTGIRRILIGSVAEKITRNASCPVMLVRN